MREIDLNELTLVSGGEGKIRRIVKATIVGELLYQGGRLIGKGIKALRD